MLISDQLTPANLDAIRIFNDRRTVALVGIALTLYLPQPHRPQVRLAVARCIEEYRELVAGKLRLAVFNGQITEEGALPSTLDRISESGEREDFSLLLTGAETLDEVSHFNLETLLLGRVSYETVGELSVTFPLGDLAHRQSGFFQNLARRWCDALSPVHGYGGFSLQRSIDPAYAEAAAPLLYPIVSRFPGLEIDMPSAHIQWCIRGIKGVNWLTILSHELVYKLGGEALLHRQFKGTGIEVRSYNNGVIIQAGAYPQLGDAEANNIPDPYRRVYRAVRAVQAHYPDMIMATPANVDSLAFSEQWLHRFS